MWGSKNLSRIHVIRILNVVEERGRKIFDEIMSKNTKLAHKCV